jgi:hypothetical protein
MRHRAGNGAVLAGVGLSAGLVLGVVGVVWGGQSGLWWSGRRATVSSLIDANLTQVHPSPWRQAVDLANMLLVLGLRTDAARVYRRARRLFTDEEIGEALAAKQGQAMPSQLRRLLATRQPDLREEFLRLLPWRPRPIAIQRWSPRRVGLWAAIVVLLFLALLNPPSSSTMLRP